MASALAKKKLSQNEIRRLMNEQRAKVQQQKQKLTSKIESPLAKYNELGQLTCILCKSIVRSDDAWRIHVNAKQHRENIELARKLKQQTQNFTAVPTKRTATAPEVVAVPEKKIKGILKNSTTFIQPAATASKLTSTTTVSPSAIIKVDPEQNGLPTDFFDSKTKPSITSKLPTSTQITSAGSHHQHIIPKQKIIAQKSDTSKMDVDDIPEGFFDDPIMDAKARNLDYKDPIEEEWSKFQKEMQEEATVSNAIIAEDQEEATADRQIDEIDEQMRNWSRVLDLEKKKRKIISVDATKMSKMSIDRRDSTTGDVEDSDEDKDDDEGDDFDEFLDWRAKKSHK